MLRNLVAIFNWFMDKFVHGMGFDKKCANYTIDHNPENSYQMIKMYQS